MTIEVPFKLSVKGLAAGEGVEPSSSGSKPGVLPVTPSRNRVSPLSYAPNRSFEFRVSSSRSITERTQNLKLGTRNSKLDSLVAAEGVEPSSLDYRSSALPLSYTAKESKVASPMSKVCLRPIDFGLSRLDSGLKMVDPTGLKPAPHGLKGRRSVTRAPSQQLQVSS